MKIELAENKFVVVAFVVVELTKVELVQSKLNRNVFAIILSGLSTVPPLQKWWKLHWPQTNLFHIFAERSSVTPMVVNEPPLQ